MKQLDKEGFSPLHRCCQEPPRLSKKPKVSGADGGGGEDDDAEMTPEQKAQNDKHRSEIVKLLVGKGADVNVAEPQGKQTPLHLAAINGYAFVCK